MSHNEPIGLGSLGITQYSQVFQALQGVLRIVVRTAQCWQVSPVGV